jgi:hypothetical protein
VVAFAMRTGAGRPPVLPGGEWTRIPSAPRR